MATAMTDEYVSVREAGRVTGITPARIRYWLNRDPRFPRGLRAGKVVVRPSVVTEYFRQLNEVQEITGPLGEGSTDEDNDTNEEE